MSHDLKIAATANSILQRVKIETALLEYEEALLEDGVSAASREKRKALLEQIDAWGVAMHKMANTP